MPSTIREEDILKMSSAQLKIQSFPTEWEQTIINLTDRRYVTHHHIIKEILDEVKKLYILNMQNINKNICPIVIEKPTEKIKITNFIKNKENLKKTYFLSHKLIRFIMKTSSQRLPNVLIDIKNYRSCSAIPIVEISRIIHRDIKRVGLHITKHFYLKIVKCMLRMNELKTMKVSCLKSLLRCATIVLGQLIVSSMMHTINHLINCLQVSENYPRMKLNLVYDQGNISLKPSSEDTFSKFHRIIDDIAEIAQDLVPLEYWMKIDVEGYIKVQLPRWFVENSHTRLQNALESTFQPLKEHCESINAQFKGICGTTIVDISSNSSKKLRQEEFHVICAHVETLNEFFLRAKTLVKEVYFDLGALSQSEASEHLQNNVAKKTNLLLTTLISTHKNFVESIYSAFEYFECRALNIPSETKPLFELCDYLSHTSKVTVKELERKICLSVEMLSLLLHIATLTEEHMEMNGKIINKLRNVEHIFTQSNNLCESKKSVLEDELQMKINVLNQEIDQFIPELIILDDMDDITRVKEYTEFLVTLVKKVIQIEGRINEINVEEKFFKFPETLFPKIVEIKEILAPFNSLVHLVCNWRRDHDIWLNGPFVNLKADEIEAKTSYYHEKLTQINASFKLKIKTEMVLSKAFKFSGIVDDSDPMQHPAPLKLCWQALRDINIFQRNVTLAICMCNKSLTQRHWNEMSTIAGFDLTPNARTTLGTIVDLNLFDNLHMYEVISISASNELNLKNRLAAMIKEWRLTSFEVDNSREPIFAFRYYSDIDSLLEDHTIKVEEMKCSNFVYPVAQEVELFSQSLDNLRFCSQRLPIIYNHMYELKIFFSSKIITNTIGKQCKLYHQTNNTFENIRNFLTEHSKFDELFKMTILKDLINEVTSLSSNLKQIIDQILQELRYSFPRFFFVTNEDIITIFELKCDDNFQICFKKCFSELRLYLNNDYNITSVINELDIEIKLNNYIKVAVNNKCSLMVNWLVLLEKELLHSLKIISTNFYERIRNTMNDCKTDILNWIEQIPGMIILVVWKIIWTAEFEDCINISQSNIKLLDSYYDRKSEYIRFLIKTLNTTTKHKYQSILLTLIINMQNEINLLTCLKKEKVDTNFLWQTQIKYYFLNRVIQISTINLSVNYGFEYCSINKLEIVSTPLTERCYHSLIIAYKNYLSCSVIGPAGVGKVETIQSLARTLGKPFYLCNCDINMSFHLIECIFAGFILQGPWLCLRNFYLINPEFYTTINKYFFLINSAKQEKLKMINFNEISLKLNMEGFLCTTSKPADMEKLPLTEETKRNFRTISLMQPDYDNIIETYLVCTGFTDIRVLTRLMCTTLSQFCILNTNENNKHLNLRMMIKIIKTASEENSKHTKIQQNIILLNTLIDFYSPKLNESEIQILQSLIRDSNLISTPLSYYHTALLKAIENVCNSGSYYFAESFQIKSIQLFEMMCYHQTLIIIGDPYAGKTSLLNLLQETLNLLSLEKDKVEFEFDYKIQIHSLNQNIIAVNKIQNFLIKSKWFDIIDNKIWHWLVFDGNSSNICYETLQTLLNDKSLFITSYLNTLSNQNRVSIIFETSNIENASPSFITKCSTIYVNSMDYMEVVINEMKMRYPNYQDFMTPLIKWSTTSCIQFLNKICSTIIHVQNNHLISSMWNLYKIFIDQAFESNEHEKEIKKDHVVLWVQAAIVLSTVWGLGGCLQEESQIMFDSFCISLWTGSIGEFPYPEKIKPFENLTLNETQLREYFYVFKGAGNWKHYGDILKNKSIIENPLELRDPYVPTINTVTYTAILQSHIKNRLPFIICSNYSSGKSAFLKYFFESKSEDMNFSVNFYHVISKMSLENAQIYILSKLIKTKHNEYQIRNKLNINFIDDLHLAIEENSASPILELIRHYMDHGYWCDGDNLYQIFLHETVFCSALSGSVKNICQRFLRHFQIYAFHPPSKDNMCRIFSNVLFSNLKKNHFTSDVMTSVTNIVNATLIIYESIQKTLKPIPIKFQYLFDLRDVWKIILCCGFIQKDSVESKITFVRLWVHETFRVLGDKITDDTDKAWILIKLKEIVKSQFKESFESVFDHLPKGKDNEFNAHSLNYLCFGNILQNETETEELNKYEELNSFTAIENKIVQYINEYNESSNEKIDITLTNYLLVNLIKLCRVLSVPGGNLLLISGHGLGRRTLTLLASHIEKQHFIEMSVSTLYNIENWKETLKKTLIDCGCSDKKVTFLFKDFHVNEKYYENISSLIKYGKIPQLFSQSEWRSIVKRVRLLAQNGDRNMELSIDNVREYFVRQCKEKLHFIICLNQYEQKYIRTFFRNYSNLTSCCFIDWWECCPQEALQQVAFYCMKNAIINEDTKNSVLKVFTYFHSYMENERRLQELRFTGNYIPVVTHYIRMVKLYVKSLVEVQQATINLQDKYKNGLEKLESTSRCVKVTNAKLTELRQQLAISSEETTATMKEIEQDNASIESATVLVKADEEVANKKATVAAILKAECEADLAVAIPILEDAIAALNTLKPTDITLVKAMKNPPDTIKLVMAAVCVMLDVPADRIVDSVTGKKIMDYWGPSKRVLSDMNFLQLLKDYNKDNISPSIMQIIQKTYMPDPSFQPRIVAKASSAAEGLCKWVRAMVSYDKVAKVVTPKKEKLAIANHECELAESYLDEKRKMLAQLNNKLFGLKNTLKVALAKKEQLESEVTSCSGKLEKAEKLVSSLINEKERWMQSVNELQLRLDNLIGDVILISGLITYLGPFDHVQRNHIVVDWYEAIKKFNLPCSADNKINVSALQINTDKWRNYGLPADSFSLENAVIAEKTLLWAKLFIDPEKIASTWIKNKEMKNCGYKVIDVYDENFFDIIKCNMHIGLPILIEDIDFDYIDNLLCIILQPFQTELDQMCINYNNEMISFNPNFKLYMISNLSQQPSNIKSYDKITVINFSMNDETLQNQILHVVIAQEKPTLFNKAKDMTNQNIKNKNILKEEEQKILNILSDAEDIMENEFAINTLVDSKKLFQKTLEQQSNCNQIQEEMNVAFNNYKPFAIFTTKLYNVIKILYTLNFMYRFSIDWFVSLCKRSLETSNRSTLFEKLLNYFKSSALKNIHKSVRKSLFNQDKLIYSFLTAINIQLYENSITNNEVNILLKINLEVKTAARKPNPGLTWLSEKCWQQICCINDEQQDFQKLFDSFNQDISLWKCFLESHDFDEEQLPSSYKTLSTFQKLIINRILRPDKAVYYIEKLITETIGNIPYYDLQTTVAESYLESSCLTPIVFLLPTYSSPLTTVLNHTKLTGCSSEITNIFLNHNQNENDIEKEIENAFKKANWVFIHNCHLSTKSQLRGLNRMLENIKVTDTMLDFRLWLSTSISEKLPVNIIQKSVKISDDNPTSLKQYLARSYDSELSNESQLFAQLLHDLFFFHAVICERKTFGVRSWNIDYEFEESDLHISIQLLKDIMSVNKDIPYKLLNYVFGKCIYGAKMLDSLDAKTLEWLLTNYCTPSVESEIRKKTRNIFITAQIKNHKHWIEFVNECLSGVDCLELFGFEKAAESSKNKMQLDNISLLLPIQNYVVLENNELEPKENFVKSTIKLVEESLSISLEVNEVRAKYPFDYLEPLNNILHEETARYNEIKRAILSSLRELEHFYNGLNVRKRTFEELERQMYYGEVPLTWKMNSAMRYTERSLPIFIAELSERLRFIKNWIDNGHPRTFLLRALTFPAALIVAIKLKFSRNYRASVNQVVIDYVVIDDSKQDFAENEVLFSELYLSGAIWNERNYLICENTSKMLYSKMPNICLQLSLKNDGVERVTKCKIPLYISSKARIKKFSELNKFSNYIAEVELASQIRSFDCIKLGAALYCDIK